MPRKGGRTIGLEKFLPRVFEYLAQDCHVFVQRKSVKKIFKYKSQNNISIPIHVIIPNNVETSNDLVRVSKRGIPELSPMVVIRETTVHRTANYQIEDWSIYDEPNSEPNS
jgi:hypothetical protein